ncbi:MAG: twin-arginine translocase TatA/TatE family subunit [Nonlabens sp.]
MFASYILGWMGPGSIALIAIVILLIFGGKKIPELMRGLGGGIKEFKDATKEDNEETKTTDRG